LLPIILSLLSGSVWSHYTIDVFAVLLPVGEVRVVSEDSRKNAILSYISKERITFFVLAVFFFLSLIAMYLYPYLGYKDLSEVWVATGSIDVGEIGEDRPSDTHSSQMGASIHRNHI
jgi:hypothetical protein